MQPPGKNIKRKRHREREAREYFSRWLVLLETSCTIATNQCLCQWPPQIVIRDRQAPGPQLFFSGFPLPFFSPLIFVHIRLLPVGPSIYELESGRDDEDTTLGARILFPWHRRRNKAPKLNRFRVKPVASYAEFFFVVVSFRPVGPEQCGSWRST